MLPFAYARPDSLGEVFTLLRANGDQAKVLSGGTDLIVGLRHAAVRPELVVDLKRVSGLPDTVVAGEDDIHVGARATVVDLLSVITPLGEHPALVSAGRALGSIQIRNRATLAGNICTASPAADTMTPLLIYRAVVHTIGPEGARSIPIEDFVTGPRRTALQEAEIVSSIRIPRPTPGTGSAFTRLTRRRGVDLATINLSCRVDPDGTTSFAFGAVGPRPFRVIDESGTLAAPDASTEEKEDAWRAVLSAATPITDVRASKEYRLAMLKVAAKRILGEALAMRATKEGTA